MKKKKIVLKINARNQFWLLLSLLIESAKIHFAWRKAGTVDNGNAGQLMWLDKISAREINFASGHMLFIWQSATGTPSPKTLYVSETGTLVFREGIMHSDDFGHVRLGYIDNSTRTFAWLNGSWNDRVAYSCWMTPYEDLPLYIDCNHPIVSAFIKFAFKTQTEYENRKQLLDSQIFSTPFMDDESTLSPFLLFAIGHTKILDIEKTVRHSFLRGYPHVSGVPYNVIPVKAESMFIATIARWTPAFAGVTNFT